jgi:glutathione peroxidase
LNHPSLYDIPLRTLDGEQATLRELEGKVLLIVNVASRCGLTPQYIGLEQLHQREAGRGFAVLGFPCNQFGGQEPGSAEEIKTFCATSYGVTFPLYEKVAVNGENSHSLYRGLTLTPDALGVAGPVQWNFEKFLVSRDGQVLNRFRPTTTPDDPVLLDAVEAALSTPAA